RHAERAVGPARDAPAGAGRTPAWHYPHAVAACWDGRSGERSTRGRLILVRHLRCKSSNRSLRGIPHRKLRERRPIEPLSGRGRDKERCGMKAIVVTDQAAGTAGMKLAERPVPQTTENDVLVEVYASGFTPGELTWPGTWTDRLGRDRTPSIPGHEVA